MLMSDDTTPNDAFITRAMAQLQLADVRPPPQHTSPRDSEPQKLLLAPTKYSLWRFPIKNISWAQVTLLDTVLSESRAQVRAEIARLKADLQVRSTGLVA